MSSFYFLCLLFFFFNDPPPTEIYPLSLHDALPISPPPRRSAHESRSRSASPPSPGGTRPPAHAHPSARRAAAGSPPSPEHPGDRKSTRLNSSHSQISYAVFCLKKKKNSD